MLRALLHILALCCLIVVGIPHTGLAQQAVPDPAPAVSVPAASADFSPDVKAPAPSVTAESYIVPAADIVAFDFLLNRYGKAFIDRGVYNVGLSSIRHNLTSGWVVDNDPFSTNQFLHPYQGAMYHGFARSTGLSYWKAAGYTFAGSALWEIAGETTPPSRNDQIASGLGGSLLGEPLFRLANLVLERSNAMPRFWRELSAAIISPSTGFNRTVRGERFKAVFPSGDPAFFARSQLGLMGTSSVRKGLTQSLTRNEVVADFSVDYGLPGHDGYAYRRPFDYFNFQFTASSANHFESIFTRGLLAGRDYGRGADTYRGVWGVYGSYDYVAPQIFRVSTTALSFGTTSQRRFSQSRTLQSTVLAGVGYGAAGTTDGRTERDYHYGMTPQLLAAMRVIPSDKAAFDLTFRDYFVSRVASPEPNGSENTARADALFTYRVNERHAASVRYVWSRRAAAYPDLGNRIQSRGTIGLFYTYLSSPRFGAVDW